MPGTRLCVACDGPKRTTALLLEFKGDPNISNKANPQM